MAQPFHVVESSDLIWDIQAKSEPAQDEYFGFVEALEQDGFEVIWTAFTFGTAGLTVEFIEPGETLQMVWARVFLDLRTGVIVLKVSIDGSDVFLSRG